MRRNVIAGVLLAAALPLAGCSDGDKQDPGSKKPPSSAARGASSPTSIALPLGRSAETVGSGGKGRLELAPTSVVYARKAIVDTPDNGLFAVVTVKVRATTAVAAGEAAPAGRGGWQWAAPDGQAVSTLDGQAGNVVLDGFRTGGDTQPGTIRWTARAFDISEAQRGGTLIYVDGEGAAYRWTVPARDAGPQVAEVNKKLAG
ncbi:hypothetical protein [Streptomyces syringium]|uniref:hypothetical protein n=1 Tax=Streptomyces syringium TaxID=76729 RepID=UPI003AACCD0C